ncbi:MAG: ABC transporter permease DevC [Pirellulaceae bacterium]
MFQRKTPLAWKNLTHDPRRLMVAVAGVGFAVLLMYMELGFLNALLDSTVELLTHLEADLIIVSKSKFSMTDCERFPLQRIQQANAHNGVRTYPLYTETIASVLREHGQKGHPIRTIAYPRQSPVFQTPQIRSQEWRIAGPNVALVDTKSRDKYGIPPNTADLPDYRAELQQRSIRLVGKFTLATDFANHGNLIMTADNFANYFPFRVPGGDPLSAVDLGIVQISTASNAKTVKTQLDRELPDDVRVFTKNEFIQREKRFWRTNTPVGYIFTVGAVMGFVIGVIICYQIIYSDIGDHLSEFATLKAMGYTNRYFVGMVLAESFYLSIFGFIPGSLVSWGLYRLIAWKTGMLMNFEPKVAVLLLASTILMCSCSGLLALRKLVAADPASLF